VFVYRAVYLRDHVKSGWPGSGQGGTLDDQAALIAVKKISQMTPVFSNMSSSRHRRWQT